MQKEVDVFIIGGGINGTAIASDAAGRGLSVVLCEKNDLGSATSSASSKLIHGGLRYLESYEFGLVRESLREREILMRRAPYLIKPLEFVLPYENHLRPAWLIRLGLLCYDCLALRKTLPHSKSIQLRVDVRGNGLWSHLTKGFSYFDCFTDDARLVILNALSAKEHGATILTHTEFLEAKRNAGRWQVLLKNHFQNEILTYSAKALINVAGPWVKSVGKRITQGPPFDIELVKGSHIVVPRLYEGDFAYILQNNDQRVVFAIPFHKAFTLIGTTDILWQVPSDQIIISPGEEAYLCDLINHYFKKTIRPSDIVWSYAGVRCLRASLAENPAKMTRDYQFILDQNEAPQLTVIGGKLTTHRLLAEGALNQLRPFFKNMGPAWTANRPLPGGDISEQNINQFKIQLANQFPWAPANLIEQYTDRYGTRAYLLLKNTNTLLGLGDTFGHGLFQKEVEYLIQEEWASSIEDILWRRTKLGLVFSAVEQQTLEDWLKKNIMIGECSLKCVNPFYRA